MGLTVEQMLSVAEIAALAPSVHNTQPWSFVATEHSLQVRADDARLLSALDPTSRQLHISCGIAVEFARLAIRYLGYDCVVRIMPGGADDAALLATLTVGVPMAVSPAERRLVEAIPRRYTDRGPYDAVPVPAALVERLGAAAAGRGCWVRPLDRRGERTIAIALLSEAEAIQAGDADVRAELETWTRTGPASDGVPMSATRWDGVDVVTDVPLRDFSGQNRHRAPDADRPPRVEHDTLLLLGSDEDTIPGWLRTGRALALILLTLTDADLVAQPLGPVTDVPATRERLQRELGLLGRPQLLLRVGYGHGYPRAARRRLDDILTASHVA